MGTEVARQEPSIMSMMEIAASKGLEGVEVLERLVALKEKEEERNARQAFNAAVAAFQSEVGPIPKNKEVNFAGRKGGKVEYRYASLDSLEKIVRPLLLKHGLSYTWDTGFDEGRIVIVFRLMHVDGHEERSSWSCPVEKQAKMNMAQSTASTTTYGKRQSMIAGLGLSTAEDDVDGQAPDDDGVVDDATLSLLKKRMDEVIGFEDEPVRKFYDWLQASFGAELLGELRMSQADEVFKALDRKEQARRSA